MHRLTGEQLRRLHAYYASLRGLQAIFIRDRIGFYITARAIIMRNAKFWSEI